jgi:hypothetical protein
VFTVLATLLVTWLPGALAVRMPIAGRERRARLSAEERAFWAVMLSVAWSLSVVLALAAAGAYAIERLLTINALLSAAIIVGWRGGLRFGGTAARPTWTILLPLALVVLGAWRFFPPAEYLIGGKDPGTYMNEGVLIAKRGALVVEDGTVAAVPASLRDLFFTRNEVENYYDTRFMGFFLLDPATGATVGQLPHLYPASIAVAYDLGGLDTSQRVTGLWGLLGLVAVFLAGARAVGPAAAFGAAVLLALNVLQVWWARYPNAEIAMQAIVFAGLLAFGRAHQDEDAFLAVVAGWLVALLPFARIESIVVIAGVAAAVLLAWMVERRPPARGFLVPIAVGGVLAIWYYTGPLAAYFSDTVQPLTKVSPVLIGVAAAGGLVAAAALLWLSRRSVDRARSAVPIAVIAAVLALAGYAWFVRSPGGRLTDYDAYALRTFTDVYFLRTALVAALIGFVLVVRRRFWQAPALILVVTAFTVFVCYKIRIMPEHFWMGRRVLPVVLPGLLLFAGAAALGRFWGGGAIRTAALRVAGAVFVVVLGWQYAAAARPVAAHVEYAGLTAYLDSLAGHFDDRDLVIVESRDVTDSDNHVFAPPLAYVFGRHVLVLESPVPDKQVLEAFLAHALGTYRRVLFLGGGGTNLLSRRIAATPVADARVKLPEYEVTPWHTPPDEVRRKDFDYSIYELSVASRSASPFVLDVGFQDDLHVVRFHAKEQTEGRTIRWTGPQCFIAVPGLTGTETTLTLVMHDGGRPTNAPAAAVEVAFDGEPLGTIQVESGFRTYVLPLPPDAVRRAATRDDPAQLRFRSTVWVPRQLLGGSDDRELGVMIDRVEIR